MSQAFIIRSRSFPSSPPLLLPTHPPSHLSSSILHPPLPPLLTVPIFSAPAYREREGEEGGGDGERESERACTHTDSLVIGCGGRWVKELKARIGNMLQKHDWTHASSKASTNSPTLEECMRWKESFERLLSNKHGLCAFTAFLVSEFSEENVAFYSACEEYRNIRTPAKLPARAQSIYDEFICCDAPREVNIDHETRDITKANLQAPSASCFDLAQHKIYMLMEKDCYPRFLRSPAYKDMTSQLAAGGGVKAARQGKKALMA